MSARVMPAPAVAGPRLSDGALELVKWIAIAAMVVDHINWFWFAAGGNPQATPTAWMSHVGRIALPLFAFCFGVNLIRVLEAPDSAAKFRRMAWRLALAGVAAQAAYWPLRGYFWPLNVLALFGLAAALAWLWTREKDRPLMRSIAVVLAVFLGLLVEYWWCGLIIIFAAAGYARAPSWLRCAAFAASTLAVDALNGNWYASLAPGVVLLAIAAAGDRAALPRLPGLWHVFYPAHLWALWFVITLKGAV